MSLRRSLFSQKLVASTLVALFSSAMGFSLISLKAQAQGFEKPTGSSRSGGVRGECFVADKERPLRALVDESNPALTTQENPTLLFYSPFGEPASGILEDGKSVPSKVEFELLNEEEESVLKKEKIVLSLPQQPGIVSLQIPSSEVRLEPNKEYFWIFRVICDQDDLSANPSVAGWIKRVDSVSSSDVWFDRLDRILRSRVNNLENWTKFLEQFGIQDLAQSSITELKPKADGQLNTTENEL
ncbi:MAG: DUF928 domain-containing protein [Symploca sp. SIO2E9]|nr:DUF928 domain-containing protein [Symploca sp. SIO2E9]